MRLGHSYLGSEHLLLGVAGQEGGGGLAAFDVTSERVRRQVVSIFGRGEDSEPGPRGMGFTPHAKSALEWALIASLILGQKAIDPEHILIALVVAEDGAAARILRECDVSPEEVRRSVVRELATRGKPWTDS